MFSLIDSRNTAQKQWDETLVLMLGGISRLLKSYFKVFQSLSDFKHRKCFLEDAGPRGPLAHYAIILLLTSISTEIFDVSSPEVHRFL